MRNDMDHKTLPEFAAELDLSVVALRRICKGLPFEDCKRRHLYAARDVIDAIANDSKNTGVPEGMVIQTGLPEVFKRSSSVTRRWVKLLGFPEAKGECKSPGNNRIAPYYSIAEIAVWLKAGGETVKDYATIGPLMRTKQVKSNTVRLRSGKVVPRVVVRVASDWADMD